MAQTTKRSPDKRKIREITTYSVSQLSQKMGKSEATIMTWIGQGGLPTIDDQKPILVYGYAFRKWHQEWWASRKKPCGPLEFYCCKCATRTPATAGTIRFSESSPGNQRGVAVCSICGHTVFRNFNVKQAMETMAASVALLNPTPGFVDSHTTTDTLGLHPDSVADGNSVVKTPIKARSANLPCNPRNERLKRRFFEFEHHARGKSEKSIQSYEIAVLRFESFLRFRDFGSLTKDEAIAFKAHLKAGPLTTPVIKATLKTVISMLKWLLGQNGYKRKTSFETLEYLNLTAKERRMSDSMEKVVSAPSPDEVDQLIRSMPTGSLVDRRNRAIIALIGMTAIRSGVIPKLRLKHLDLELGLLHQRSSEVDTKFSKSNTSILLPLKDGWLEILHAYVSELQTLGYIADDPLFPKTTVSRGKGVAFGERSMVKDFMADAQMVERMLPDQFAKIGHKPYHVHSFRHMHARLADGSQGTIGLLRALGGNMSHATLATTLASYGKLSLNERQRIVAEHFSKAGKEKPENFDELIKMIQAWKSKN